MNLKELAKAKGTNVKKLAEKCGVASSTLYAISGGGTNLDNIGIDLFLKVSNALGMTAESLRRELSGNGVHYAMVRLDVDEQPPAQNTAVQELVDLCSKLNDQQIEILLSTARNFAVANEKDGAWNTEDVERAGIVLS